jgi:hypothetical protein
MYDYTVTREALDRELEAQGITGADTDKLTIAVQMAMMLSRATTGMATVADRWKGAAKTGRTE